MTTFKRIPAVLMCIPFVLVACPATAIKDYQDEAINQDTSYIVSTKQLKSDKIPDSVCKMTNLRRLEIAGEDCDYRQRDKNGHDRTQCWMLREIPSEIKTLQKLTTLRLPLNAIRTIPNELSALKNLRVLDLTDNAGIENIDNLSAIVSLENLALYGCGLTKLPDNMGNLRNLKELGLVGNHLDEAEQTRIRKALPSCVIRF